MRNWKLWLIALIFEFVLVAVGRHLVASNASLSAGIAFGMTQLPGLPLSQRILGTSAPLWQLDALMAVFQILLFGLVLHAIKFVWDLARAKRREKS